MTPWKTLVRKEWREDLWSGRGAAFLAITALVMGGFAVLLVSNTELSLLANAEAVYFMAGILLAIAFLASLLKAADGFAGERERETLETLLLTRLTGTTTALAKLTGLVLGWLVLFAVGLPYIWAVGSTGQNLRPTIAYLFVAGSLLIVAAGSLMLALSARLRSVKTALSIGLSAFLLLAAPLVMGASLRQNAVGRAFDWINPFSAALNTLDSVTIDSQGFMVQVPRLAILLVYALGGLLLLRSASAKVRP